MRSTDAWAAEIRRELEAAPADARPIAALVGPTASGKTALAIALAEAIGGEVVSVDSVQIYRGFDIGSGKPTAEELTRARHHLISEFDPTDAVDAAVIAKRARAAIVDIESRGRTPIVCGGTFLWHKAIFSGLAELPAGNEEVRARHRDVVANESREALHDRLRAIDPASAARLHPRDVVRVSRALEVHELSGTPMSKLVQEHGFRTAWRPARYFAIRQSSETLTARIQARVRGFMAVGWLDEVRDLIARGYGQARPMGSVGYREVRAHLAGELPMPELEVAVVRSTRVFARRQRTWLNHEPVTWFEDAS